MATAKYVSILTILVQILLPEVVKTSNFVDTIINLSYQDLLEDVLITLDASNAACSLRVVANQQDLSTLMIPTAINLKKPVQLLTCDFARNQTEQLKLNHKDHCWNVLIWVSSVLSPLTSQAVSILKLIGHPVHDNFVFVSLEYYILSEFLIKTQALNLVRKKVAIYFPGNASIKFLSEPELFNGDFMQTTTIPCRISLNNLNGRIIKLVHLNLGLPFKQVGDHDHAGVFFDLFEGYSKRFNFSYDLYNEHIPPGKLSKNGSWSGLVGELQHGPADVIAALGISYERYPYVDYTTPIYWAPITFTVKEPMPELQWNALLSPLTLRVWLFTLVSVGGLTTVFIILEYYLSLRGKSLGGQRFVAKILEAALSPITIVLEQDKNVSQKAVTIKTIALLCILLSFVVGTAYKSNLVGFLTFPRKPLFPKSFADLYMQKDYKLALVSVGGLELSLFKSTGNAMLKDFSKRLQILSLKEIGKCMDIQMKSKTVCVSWRSVIQTGAIRYGLKWPQQKRSIFMVDDGNPILNANVATVLKKNSILQVALNNWLGYSRDSGIVSKLVTKFWYEETERLKKYAYVKEGDKEDRDDSRKQSNGKPIALKLQNFLAVSFAYFCGAALAIPCLLIEIAVDKWLD